MGRGDRCAVYMCNNDRRYKNKLLVKDHIRELKWHYCPPKYRKLWQQLLNRKDFHITDNTRICSNHFVLGRPYGQHPHPCLYMRGYAEEKEPNKDNTEMSTWLDTSDESDYIKTRPGQIKRKLRDGKSSNLIERPHSCEAEHSYSTSAFPPEETSEQPDASEPTATASPSMSSSSSPSDVVEEHGYSSGPQSSAACACVKCDGCKLPREELENENTMLQNELERFRQMLAEDKSVRVMDNSYDIRNIKYSDELVMLHTGLQSYALFNWLYKTVEPKLLRLQCCNTSRSDQFCMKNQPGPKRKLSPQNELLVTLMKLKLNLSEHFLSRLFGTSPCGVSQILSTWLPLMSSELKALLHWPTPEELTFYYPHCFRKYKRVTAIIDCMEVPVQRANGQIYKGRDTAKVLVACTPAGTISFVSKAAGGNLSDKEMVRRSGFLDYLQPGDTVLASRGFNIQALLLEKQVSLVRLPLFHGEEQLSQSEDKNTKNEANARGHVERVIGRVRDFNIMKAELPLDMFDVFDHIAVVVAALVNLQPEIVPLECE